MGRFVPEETIEVWLVTTVADPAAPTATELNAGVDITGSLIGDLDLPFEGSTADSADMSSKFNSVVSGDYGGQPGSMTIHKEKAVGDDAVYIALTRTFIGWLALANRGLATPGTWAIGDEVDLVPIEILARTKTYARNTTHRAVIGVAITGVPTEEFDLVA